MRLFFAFLLLATTLATIIPAGAQAVPDAPCGVVDSIGDPVENMVAGYDDFDRYRERFGGNHVGLDTGFDRWGDPVRAVARGRVTYSNPEGWDTEKGVVIVEHIFPDGSRAYSLYGHVEQTDTIGLATLGACVEMGSIVGAIGWPSRGRPHLHFEFRNFLPDDGGPGYTTGNPLEEGWYNPLEFTALWRARFNPAYLSSLSYTTPASAPAVVLDSGTIAAAEGDLIVGLDVRGAALWRVRAEGQINRLAALPGDRVAAHTVSGQALVLQGGRYAAVWNVEGASEPFLLAGETLVFRTAEGGLAGYDAAGALLWSAVTAAGSTLISADEGVGGRVGVVLQTPSGGQFRVLDSGGQALVEIPLAGVPLASPAPDGSWWLVLGSDLLRVAGPTPQPIAGGLPAAANGAVLRVDGGGNAFWYPNDSAHTLLALDNAGNTRWQIAHRTAQPAAPPLLAVGNGCLLYTLDADGVFSAYRAADGTLAAQITLYPGGSRAINPSARALRVDGAEQVTVSAGYLSQITFNGSAWCTTG